MADLSYESLCHAVLYSCRVENPFVNVDIMKTSDHHNGAGVAHRTLWLNALMGTHCAVPELTNLLPQRSSILDHFPPPRCCTALILRRIYRYGLQWMAQCRNKAIGHSSAYLYSKYGVYYGQNLGQNRKNDWVIRPHVSQVL